MNIKLDEAFENGLIIRKVVEGGQTESCSEILARRQ
jgi:hypothetical protein